MNKEQAFETIIQVVTQFRGTISECNAVQEAVTIIGKELKIQIKEEEDDVVTDLENKKSNKI
jgi:hypothetical protein